MKPRRLHSETITSRFMGSPRLRLRLVLPHSWARLALGCASHGQSHGLTPEVGSSRRTSRRNWAGRLRWPISRQTWASSEAPISFSLQPVRSARARQQRHAFDNPRRLPEPLEVTPHPVERVQDVEMVDPDQLASARVEEDHLTEGEELERAGEPRPDPARGLGDATDLTKIARVKGDHPVALAERERADDDRRRFAERHQ